MFKSAAVLILLVASAVSAQTSPSALADWSKHYREGDLRGVQRTVEANLLSAHPDPQARFIWCSIAYSLGQLTRDHLVPTDPRLVKVLGDDPEIYFYWVVGDYTAVENHFVTQAAQHSDDFVTLMHLGIGDLNDFQYSRALDVFFQVTIRFPDRFWPAWLAYQVAVSDNALRPRLEAALTPGHPLANTLFAQVVRGFLRSGETNDSEIELAGLWLKSNPTDADALRCKGVGLLGKGNTAEAETTFEAANAAFPFDLRWDNEAKALLLLYRYQDADRFVRQVSALRHGGKPDDDESRAHLALALSRVHTGRASNAASALLEPMADAANVEVLQTRLAMANAKADGDAKDKEIAELQKQLAALRPEDSALQAKVIQDLVAGDPEQALTQFLALRQRVPHTLELYYAGDMIYQKLGDDRARLANARDAVKQLPEGDSAALLLTYNLISAGLYPEALATLETAYTISKPSEYTSMMFGEIVSLTDGPAAVPARAAAEQARWPSLVASSAQEGAEKKRIPHGTFNLTASARESVADPNTARVRLVEQVGHSDSIEAIDLSPDGSIAATGSGDRSVILWDVASGRVLRRLRGTGALAYAIRGVAFSADGQTVIASSDQGPTLQWSVETGKLLDQLKIDIQYGARLAASADGLHLLALEDDGTAHLYPPSAGEEAPLLYPDFEYPAVKEEEHGFFLNSGERSEPAKGGAAFSPDGHDLAIISGLGIVLHNLASGRPGLVIPITVKDPLAISYAAGNTLVLLGSEAGVQVFDTGTGKLRATLATSSPATAVAGAGAEHVLLAGTAGGDLLAWNSDSFTPLFHNKDGSQITAIRALPNPHPGSRPGEVRALISSRHRARLLLLPEGRTMELESHVADVSGVYFSAAATLTLFDDQGVRSWGSSGSQKPLTFREDLHPLQVCGGSTYLAYNKTGLYLQSFDNKHSERLSDLPYIQHAHCSEEHGLVVAAGSGGELLIFHGSGKSPPMHIKAEAEDISAMSVSRDQTLVATASHRQGVVHLFDIATGTAIPISRIERSDYIMGPFVTSLRFSPDGHWLLAANGAGYVTRIDLQTHKLLGNLPGPRHGVFSLSISRDSTRFLAGGTGDPDIFERDIKTGQVLHHWTAAALGVAGSAYSLDGNTILTAGSAGEIDLWDANTVHRKLSFFLFTDGSWAAVDPEGRYDASDPSHASGLQWVAGTRIIELQQLKQRFYTPDLLARVLRDERLPDVSGMDTIALPPRVTLARAYDPATHMLHVNVAGDKGGGVGNLLVKVNDRLVEVKRDSAGEASIDLSNAPLVTGDNVVQIAAFDAAGAVQSQPIETHVALEGIPRGTHSDAAETSAADAGHFYAILVGTSTFADPAMNLTFPARDAQSLALGLRLGAERLYGKERVSIRLLTSSGSPGDLPTKANIRAAFDDVRAHARPEDTLVVYFSGHGAMLGGDRDTWFYLTADARTLNLSTDTKLRELSTVSSAELFQWLREPLKTMPLKEVVILDTCAAGAASTDLLKLAATRDVPPDQKRAIELLKDATGTFILMGSAADAVSYEASRYGQGLLTYSLLEGMRGRSLDDGSRLNVSRWFQNASEEVPDLAKSIGGIQRPLTAAPGGRTFPIGLLTLQDRQSIPAAKARPLLLRVQVTDADQNDPLHLASMLREQLRAQSRDAAGAGTSAMPPVYMDDADEETPGALRPKVLYSVEGPTVRVRIRLTATENKSMDRTLTAPSANVPGLAAQIAATVLEMAAVP